MEFKIIYRSKNDCDFELDGKKIDTQKATGTLLFGKKEDVIKMFGEEKPTLVAVKVSDDGRFDECIAGMQWMIDQWYK